MPAQPHSTPATKSARAPAAFGKQDAQLDTATFDLIATFLYSQTGITLSPKKIGMVEARLSSRLRATGLADYRSYLKHVEAGTDAAERTEMVNALTTNLTRFFREDHHFETLRSLLDQLAARSARRSADGRRRLRIWSAGCSTGPEPYSIAMTLADQIPDLDAWDAKILATDIDTKVLETARAATFPAADVIGPDGLVERWTTADGRNRVISPILREMVHFKPLNLIAQWQMSGPFDAIFCRNVAIYFDRPVQAHIFNRMHGLLADDGLLFIGHSENLAPVTDVFTLLGKTVYRKTGV
ncbi:MAG: protein-glutamate O-methyltransferase [Pseudomonadota bacterium]